MLSPFFHWQTDQEEWAQASEKPLGAQAQGYSAFRGEIIIIPVLRRGRYCEGLRASSAVTSASFPRPVVKVTDSPWSIAKADVAGAGWKPETWLSRHKISWDRMAWPQSFHLWTIVGLQRSDGNRLHWPGLHALSLLQGDAALPFRFTFAYFLSVPSVLHLTFPGKVCFLTDHNTKNRPKKKKEKIRHLTLLS